MSKVKVGLVQMSCVKEKQPNLDKAIKEIRELHKKGAQIVCLQELFTSLYFCDVEDYENFKLAEPIPGPSTDAFGPFLQKSLASSLLPPYLKSGHKEYTTTPPQYLMQTVRIWGSIERCTFRMILRIMKSFISLR